MAEQESLTSPDWVRKRKAAGKVPGSLASGKEGSLLNEATKSSDWRDDGDFARVVERPFAGWNIRRKIACTGRRVGEGLFGPLGFDPNVARPRVSFVAGSERGRR